MDAATQRQLARGSRLVEILKQGQYAPIPVEKQIVIIHAGTQGFLDSVPVEKLKLFEEQLMPYIEGKDPEFLKKLGETGKLDGPDKTKLETMLKEFAEQFTS